MNESSPRVKCPSCGQTSIYSSANPWRPFCSERCKQIDLGAWASEQFRVPDPEPSPDASDMPATAQQPKLH